MLLVIGILGIIALALAIIHLFMPQGIKMIDSVGKRTIEFSQVSEKYRIVLGIFYLVAGILFIFAGFISK